MSIDSDKNIAGHSYIVSVGLICLAVLALFYPVLDGGTIDLDDTSLLARLNSNPESFSIGNLWFPSSPVTYYRPVLMLTYVLDHQIWQLYHLTNVLLHLLNGFLVYLIAGRLYREKAYNEWPAILTALSFSIHPLTCESVAWISGRSDIVSLFFSLITVLVYLSTVKGRHVYAAAFFYLGILSKESALVIFPLLLLYEWCVARAGQEIQIRFIETCKWGLILSLPLFFYAYARTAGFDFSGAEAEIMHTSGKVFDEGSDTAMMTFLKVPAAIAFYIKKLVIPYPLNLSIDTIHGGLYLGLFVILCATCMYVYVKRLYGVLLFLMIIPVTFSPALLLMWADVAWTPYAERYLYFSIALVPLGLGELYYLYENRLRPWKKTILCISVCVITVFGISTFHRNVQWSDKRSLWADTFRKNPESPKVLYKYGTTLGRERGLEYIKKSASIAGIRDWLDLSLLYLAEYDKSTGRFEHAVQGVKKAVAIVPTVPNYIEARRIATEIIYLTPDDHDENIRFVIHCSEELYRLRNNPNDLYQVALWHSELKDYKTSKDFYKKLISTHPDSRLVKHALKEMKKLDGLSDK